MPVKDKEFEWRVFRLIEQLGIKRTEAIAEVECATGRSAPAGMMANAISSEAIERVVSTGKPLKPSRASVEFAEAANVIWEKVVPHRPDEMTLRMGNAPTVRIRVSA
jgi:hypothetical protein